MADQTRAAAIAALKVKLETLLVTAPGSPTVLRTIYDGPRPTGVIPDSAYPCLCIIEGTDVVERFITGEREITLDLGLMLHHKETEAIGRAIDDAVIKIVEQATLDLLGGTVLNIWNVAAPEQPFAWPVVGDGIKWRGRVISIIYEQQT